VLYYKYFINKLKTTKITMANQGPMDRFLMRKRNRNKYLDSRNSQEYLDLEESTEDLIFVLPFGLHFLR